MADTTPPPRLALRYAALSDVGRVRKDNQDSGYAGPNLLVIADGVGGAARGDVASRTAVQILRRLDTTAPADMQEALAGALHRAHDRLAELVEQDPELDGTSTTVTAALFDGAKVTLGHVGDSRAYLLRSDELSQLTADHTFVQTLVDEGRITEEQSRSHPHRNLILRAVDAVHETEPDLFDVVLVPGDRLLLCSDGCSGVLDAARIAVVLGAGTVDYAVVELIRASLEAGSTDNVTVVVADVVDADAPADDPDLSAAAAIGPMLVGAAAEQARPPGAGGTFAGHRGGDTGEIEPVGGDQAEVDPEALRYAPRPPRRFVWLRWGAVLVVLGAVAVAGGMLAWNWSQKQYYVAVSDDSVAIYRGIQADLPGVETHRVTHTTEVTVASLPEYRAAQVRAGIAAADLSAAEEIVTELTSFARPCPEPDPSPTPSPSRQATPGASPGAGDRLSSPKPSATVGGPSDSANPSASPSVSPSPSPSPTPTLAPPDCLVTAAGSGGTS